MQSKRINPNVTYFKKLKLHTVKLYSKDQSCQKLKTQDSKHVWSKDYQGKSELAFIDQWGKRATGRPKTKFMIFKYLRAQNLLLKSQSREKGVLIKQSEFEFIHDYSKAFPLTVLFRLTSFSQSGYYKGLNSHSTSCVDPDEEL